MKWLVYLLSLPVSVYVYASLLAVIDATNKVRPLVRLIGACCVVLGAVTVTNPLFLGPMMLGLITVVGIHWITFFSIRKWGLGMPVYGNRPKSPEPVAELDLDTSENS